MDNTGGATAGVYANDIGYRPWMRNGVTFTGNSDLGYLGQTYNGSGVSDMVFNWSDATTTGPWTADKLRFVFTSTPDASTNGMGSDVGLEAMRMWPADADNVNVGIGDWLVSGSGEPDERLDVLTGRVRIRELPDPSPSVSDDIVVVDADGILEHRPMADFPDHCEWTMDLSAPNNVWTAFGSSDPDCPDEDDNVGIGDDSPTSKLSVFRKDVSGSGANIGILANTDSENGSNNYAIQATCEGLTAMGAAAPENYGVDALAKNGVLTFGVKAKAQMDNGKTSNNDIYGSQGEAVVAGTTVDAYGVRGLGTAVSGGTIRSAYGTAGIATGAASSTVNDLLCGAYGRATGSGSQDVAYGLWGEADASYNSTSGGRYGVYAEAAVAAKSWAGYLNGDFYYTGSFTSSSDANLKSNIEELDGASVLLNQLEPKTFEFNTVAFSQINLPTGPQMGLIAQDVQNVLPQLVHNGGHPGKRDASGNMIVAPIDYLTLDYVSLIPLLIAGFKEQQAVISDLQDQVNGCCTEGMAPEGGTGGIGYIDNTQSASGATRQLSTDELVVTPNPFTENPTISYRIGTGGRAQLRVTSASSRDMGVLFDAGTEAGQHSMVWNTEGMAPGLYLLTLTVDGKRVTEQAVKVE
ncbi:MAG: tail fiber domain-containing protein [Flavobacteriales bacterium]